MIEMKETHPNVEGQSSKGLHQETQILTRLGTHHVSFLLLKLLIGI